MLLNKIDEDFYNLAIVHIKELKEAKPELNETLEFHESTLNAQRRVSLIFQPDVSAFKADTCRGRNLKGLPLLKPEQADRSISSVTIKRTAALTTVIRRRRTGNQTFSGN